MSVFRAILRRDLRLAFLRGTEGVSGVAFFFIACVLFALAVGTGPAALKSAAPAFFLLMSLLSSLLTLENIWHRDFDDGTYDLLLASKANAFSIICAKTLAHWTVSGLLLTLAAVPLMQMFYIDMAAVPVIALSLLVAGVYMSLLGGFGAVLTMGSRKPALLLALLILPLFVPMLVLSVMAADAALAGFGARPYILLQAALCIAFLPLCLMLGAALLKSGLRT